MDMADEYMTGLGEALFQATDDRSFTPRQRRFTASIVRAGTLAAIEIGSSPNPDTGLLDLLVLVTLQRSAIERMWLPQEWPGVDAEPTLTRLRRIEERLWEDASAVLSESQKSALRSLIDEWIAENPDRRSVELVRFRDFTKTRNMPALDRREQARGLLREVTEAVQSIDDARLFGERILWVSIRMPAVVGAQVEQTSFHLASEPEIAELRSQVEAFREYAERATAQAEALPSLVDDSITRLTGAVAAEREAFITTTFDRFGEERTATLEELERRSGTLESVLLELQETLRITSQLATSVDGSVNSVGRIVARFDQEGRESEPLDIEQVRLAAVAIGDAADRLTQTLDRTNDTLDRTNLVQPLAQLNEIVDRSLVRVFWGAIGIVAFLLVGLGLLKLVPSRSSKRMG